MMNQGPVEHVVTRKKRIALYGMMVLLVILTGLMVLCIFWLLRPYDLVRFGEPNGTVLTPVVYQGGAIVIENPSYCVDDVDTHIERWADEYDNTGDRIASYQMFSIELYGAGHGLVCNSPSKTLVTLPNYVIGIRGERSTFKIRQLVTYRPNPVRVVAVELETNSFIVAPISEGKANG